MDSDLDIDEKDYLGRCFIPIIIDFFNVAFIYSPPDMIWNPFFPTSRQNHPVSADCYT